MVETTQTIIHMSARNLVNVVILSVVVILAIIAFYPSTSPEPPPPMAQLLPLSKSDINMLNIHSHDKPVQRFSKQDKRWFMTEPLHIKASEHRYRALIEP